MKNKFLLIAAISLYIVASVGVLTIVSIKILGIINTKEFLLYSAIFVFLFIVSICFLIAFLPKRLKWLKYTFGAVAFWIFAFGVLPMIVYGLAA